mmetsp:Transcript_32210/g.102460  ORF Transcript_32210/g.102460 Transcript_32210/m.102460 type:complete len:249 (-) Transcript_32210:393-1139(-)
MAKVRTEVTAHGKALCVKFFEGNEGIFQGGSRHFPKQGANQEVETFVNEMIDTCMPRQGKQGTGIRSRAQVRYRYKKWREAMGHGGSNRARGSRAQAGGDYGGAALEEVLELMQQRLLDKLASTLDDVVLRGGPLGAYLCLKAVIETPGPPRDLVLTAAKESIEAYVRWYSEPEEFWVDECRRRARVGDALASLDDAPRDAKCSYFMLASDLLKALVGSHYSHCLQRGVPRGPVHFIEGDLAGHLAFL